MSVAVSPLVDERTGLITRVDRAEPPPWWPDGLAVYSTSVGAVSRHLPWPADRVSTGTAFNDPERARIGAIGEAVERYCGNFIPAGLRRSSYADLVRAGERAVDPASLALYSAAQYAEPGCPFTRFTPDLPVLWSRGVTLGRDESEIWVPSSLAYINYAQPPREAEPLTNFVMLAGIAAGPDLRASRAAALEEVIERDATVIWWANRLPAAPVGLDDPRLAHLLRPAPDLGEGWGHAVGGGDDLSYRVVALPTVFDVAVIGVLLRDPVLDLSVFGVAARPDPAAAVAKALAEAVTLRVYALGLLEPGGAIWRAVADGDLDPGLFHPHRADRAYASSYRADFRDVVDLACHSQIWLDPAMGGHLAPITAEGPPVALDRLPAVTGDVYHAYLDRLAAAGLAAHAVDLTTPDVAAAGLRVSRVVVPGAYSNAPAAFPLLGGTRLYDDPVRLGLRAEPLAEADVNFVPLPHT
ncbi:ribosomal protein S12 methylthiotransferase accessory factor [Sinosporangium album]|uniref:Ribosomal protein S12 methylthiotransferase accessory factor n=1 Tax=Sinosporangium album TaxID=504805 RepID=A0A1G7ZT26_9ACTN|nr:YcaO-like family protein [Sinosporangium album]SDH11838.1 ribosomal protein S12 methylthiotransferase accessory factor [Sinosporangium album]